MSAKPLSSGKKLLYGLIATAASTLLVYVVVGMLPKTYESRLSLVFPTAASNATGPNILVPGVQRGSEPDFRGLGADPSLTSPILGSSPSTAEGLLKSEKCRQFVVDQLGLDKVFDLSKIRAAKELGSRVKIRIDENRFLLLSAQAESPELSKRIADSYLEFLGQESVSLTLNVGKRNSKALENRLTASEAVVEEALAQLIAVAQDHPYADTGGLASLIVSATKQLQDARAASRSAKVKLDSLETGIKRALAEGDRNALDALGANAALASLATELEKRRLELAEAERQFTDQSPEVKIAKDRARGAENAVAEAIGKARTDVGSGALAPLIEPKAELAGLEATVRSYEAALNTAMRTARRAPEDAARLRAAQTRYDQAVTTRESLRSQLQLSKIAEERDPARFEVVDRPYEDPQWVSPRRGLLTGGWAALCLAALTWWVARGKIRWVE